MNHRRSLLFVMCAFAAVAVSGFARGDVVISFEAFMANGQPIAGPVAPGTAASVDIFLSADADDAPVEDVRYIQFDFDATGNGITLDGYTWTVSEDGYSFRDPDLPLTNVTSVLFSSSPSLLILTNEPIKVGTVDITIMSSGTLDAVNDENIDPNYGADVRAGFSISRIFRSEMGNLQGGTIAFTVTSNGGGIDGVPEPTDTDGDGVFDDDDHFPNDPNETTDTDDNGVGDNADPDDDGDGVPDDDDADPLDPDVGEVGGNGNENGNSNDNGNQNDNGNTNSNSNNNDNSNANNNDNSNSNDNGNGGGGAGAPRACGAGMLGPGLLMLLSLGLVSFGGRRGRT